MIRPGWQTPFARRSNVFARGFPSISREYSHCSKKKADEMPEVVKVTRARTVCCVAVVLVALRRRSQKGKEKVGITPVWNGTRSQYNELKLQISERPERDHPLHTKGTSQDKGSLNERNRLHRR
jgi:hypothetical protein